MDALDLHGCPHFREAMHGHAWGKHGAGWVRSAKMALANRDRPPAERANQKPNRALPLEQAPRGLIVR